MKSGFGKMMNWLWAIIAPGSKAYRLKLESMASRPPETKKQFLGEFDYDPVAVEIAERCYHSLVEEMSPTIGKEFVPYLEDDLGEDYLFDDLDAEELLFDLLPDYDLPKKEIHGNGKVIGTVRDLIEFAYALTPNYPKKSDHFLKIKPSFTNFLPLGSIPMALSIFFWVVTIYKTPVWESALGLTIISLIMFFWYQSHSIVLSENHLTYKTMRKKTTVRLDSITNFKIGWRERDSFWNSFPDFSLWVDFKLNGVKKSIGINAQVFGQKEVERTIKFLESHVPTNRRGRKGS